ncbi:MAG: transposase [Rhodanobacter sp.]
MDTGCTLHTYVLMTNHVHLLATSPKIGAIDRLMQKLGRGCVGQLHAHHQRTEKWREGRYKTSLVDSQNDVSHRHRTIELNLVRARTADDPPPFRGRAAPPITGFAETPSSCRMPHTTRSPPHHKRAPKPIASCCMYCMKPCPTTT